MEMIRQYFGVDQSWKPGIHWVYSTNKITVNFELKSSTTMPRPKELVRQYLSCIKRRNQINLAA